MKKLLHYAFDAVLISTVLAGIKRSTGIQAATDNIEGEIIRTYVDKYLGLGEWIFDMTTVFLKHSPYFIKGEKEQLNEEESLR